MNSIVFRFSYFQSNEETNPSPAHRSAALLLQWPLQQIRSRFRQDSARVVAVSPRSFSRRLNDRWKKSGPKRLIATKAPPKWFAKEVSGEELRSLMTNQENSSANGTTRAAEGNTIFFPMKFWGEDIYRVLKSEYEVEDPFPLTPLKSKWRSMEIAQVPLTRTPRKVSGWQLNGIPPPSRKGSIVLPNDEFDAMSSSVNQLQRGRLTGCNFNGNGLDHRSRRLRKPRAWEQIAGPPVLLALVIAGGVATCNGLSSAQLAANHPVSGGTYEYGHRWLSPISASRPDGSKIRFRRYGGYRHLLCSRSYDPNRFGHGGRSNGGYPNRDAKKQCRERHHRLRRPAFSPSLRGDWLSVITNNNEFLSPIFDSTRKSAFLEATALMFVAYTGYGLASPPWVRKEHDDSTGNYSNARTDHLYLGVCRQPCPCGRTGIWISLPSRRKNRRGEARHDSRLGSRIGLAQRVAQPPARLVTGGPGHGKTGRFPKQVGQVKESTKVPAIATVLVAVIISGLVCRLEANLELQRVHGACLLRRDQPVRHPLEP